MAPVGEMDGPSLVKFRRAPEIRRCRGGGSMRTNGAGAVGCCGAKGRNRREMVAGARRSASSGRDRPWRRRR